MVATAATRKIFIDSALAFLKKHQLDGLSLDWEYPGNRGSPAGDKEKYILLLQEILASFVKDAVTQNSTRYILTASVGAGSKVIAKAYEISKMAMYLDWINLMAYDLHGSWENVTGCTTAMKGVTPTVPNSLDIWLSGGMPANKITLGLAAYGRSFQLKSYRVHGLGAPAIGPGSPGQYTRASGSLAFYEMCDVFWDEKVSWAYSAAGATYAYKGNQWVGYDTESSIKHKVTTLINKFNLRGFSFWALDFDDFAGNICNLTLGKYPLLKTAVQAMTNLSKEKIKFHPSPVNLECTAVARWKHVKSLVMWCKKHCQTQECPSYMCVCY